jgi:uncharacterized protein (TIGR01777 family)
MRVFVTGGTGLIGTHLVQALVERGDHVVVLTRRPPEARKQCGDRCLVVEGDPIQPGPWQEEISRCDAVVHLAGEGIFNRRWNADFKEQMRVSRVQGAANIAAALARSPRRADGAPRTFVSASAIGYYGPRGDEELTESSPPGDDFMAGLCLAWETAANAAQSHGVRVLTMRTGIVLAKERSALQKMMTPFKMFVGGKVGSGRQYMSWIHIDDIVGLYLLALDQANLAGPVNGTAPEPVTNKQFSKILGRVMGRPSFMPAPALGLRIALGEVAQVVTKGQRVVPRVAQAAGYRFKFSELETALRNLLEP